MKKYIFFLSFLTLITMLDYSCKKPIDECENVNCNNGNCVLGDCKCDYGWSGTDCTTKKINYFTGDWTGSLKCLTNTDTITLRIKEIGSSVDVLKINTVDLVFKIGDIPLSFDSYTMNAVMDSSFNSFVIDTLNIKQKIPFNGNEIEFEVAVSGDGNKTETDSLSLRLNFLITQLNQSITCQGVFGK